jgi:Mature-T-Cell Proliferation I type
MAVGAVSHAVCSRSYEHPAVQKCLVEQGYQQHECQDVIERLYRCCEAYDLFGRSPNCAGLPARGRTSHDSAVDASAPEAAVPAARAADAAEGGGDVAAQ